MAFPKIPKEHHALFYQRIPRDPRIETKQMFGAAVGMVNGQLFGGLWGNSIMVKLSPADSKEAAKLDGTYPFDPMQTGRQMMSALVLPDDVVDEPDEMRAWLKKAFEYTATLPPKRKKAPAKKKKRPTPSSA
ncbi:MAG TPA: TfoX/Sxy family protein [Kofleriaceae bacterium]|jgi:TfoX/Sxy family transcriptional regulator of competence genes